MPYSIQYPVEVYLCTTLSGITFWSRVQNILFSLDIFDTSLAQKHRFDPYLCTRRKLLQTYKQSLEFRTSSTCSYRLNCQTIEPTYTFSFSRVYFNKLKELFKLLLKFRFNPEYSTFFTIRLYSRILSILKFYFQAQSKVVY